MVNNEIIKLKFDNSFNGRLFAVQGDTGRVFNLQVFDDYNKPVDVTGMKLRMYVANSKEVSYSEGEIVTAAEGKIKVQVYNSQLKYPGKQKAQFVLTDKDGQKIGSKIFDLWIEEGLEAGSTVGNNIYVDFDKINQILDLIKNYDKTLEEAKKIDSSLKVGINKGIEARNNLADCKKKALEIKGQLDISKVDAQNVLKEFVYTKNTLIDENKKANSNLTSLDAKIVEGKQIANNLEDKTSTAKATDAILKATDTEAKNTESLIKGLMSQLNLTKDEVNKIIAAGDLSKYVTDPKLQEALKLYAKKTEVNELIDQRVKEEAKNPRPKIMTAVIDQTNSNPLTCVTYEDDARKMEKGSAEWDEFFSTKLVLFKNGKEVRDLQDSELNSLKPEDGDVMVKFKRMGLNIKTVGDKVYVSMTDNPDDDNFKYYAHTRGVARKEAFYLGAYLGFLDGNKLRSVTGKKPQDNKSITDFRTYAQANGKGYELCGFYQLTFLQAMYVLKYGNLDSQTAIGKGLTSGGQSATNTTGATNGQGIDYGTTSDTQQMRFQFLEDFYGNRIWAIDGIATDPSCVIYTTTDNFNSGRSGYLDTGVIGLKSKGWLGKVYGTTELGFLSKELRGSSNTYYSDYSYIYANCFLFFGGVSNTGVDAGAFLYYLYCGASEAYWILAARLMYL